MSFKQLPYNQSLSLLTDLYQLTMSYGYFKNNRHEEEAVFHLFYRQNPFKGSFAIAAGLEPVIDFINNFSITNDDIDFLRTLTGNDAKPLFDEEYLSYLAAMEFSCDIDAIPEGTIVFPHEPLVRVKGPIIQCQILETALLNIINFQILVATKSARICHAAQGEPVMEFGLRRAQGIDGSLSATRAAYVGGCHATSNVLAGKMYGIPVKGTHAHSWVMSFDDEQAAFEAYAKVMPNNCVFLVDTYDTLHGVDKAIQTAKKLREKGHEMIGIRLDSGSLAKLSIQARKKLDAAGFEQAAIIASNDLDEKAIREIKNLGGKVNTWGIGTKLVTCHDQPALGGVYKIAGIRKSAAESWNYKIKLSEDPIKVSQPGVLQVRRYLKNGQIEQDVICDISHLPEKSATVFPLGEVRSKKIQSDEYIDLLQPIYRQGQCVYRCPALAEVREYSILQQQTLPLKYWALEKAPQFSISLEEQLYHLKMDLLAKAKSQNDEISRPTTSSTEIKINRFLQDLKALFVSKKSANPKL